MYKLLMVYNEKGNIEKQIVMSFEKGTKLLWLLSPEIEIFEISEILGTQSGQILYKTSNPADKKFYSEHNLLDRYEVVVNL